MGVIVFFFVIGGVGFLAFGAMVISAAPAVTQEMAGIMLMLCGIVSAGFGVVIALLQDIKEKPVGISEPPSS